MDQRIRWKGHMTGEMDLSKLKKGQCAVVRDIIADDSMRRRLQDIGLIQGTNVTCVQKSPLGDPTAYLIRGAIIALRQEDSSCVKVKLKIWNS